MKNNWQVKKLGQEGVAKVIYGKAKPEEDGSVPVIGSSGIYSYTKAPLVTKPTIIVGRKGTAGVAYYSENPCWPSDTAFYLDINFDLFDPKFLYLFITHKKLDGQHSKTTLPSLKRQDLEELLVPLLDLQEQKNIVSIMDTVQEAIKIQSEAIENTKELKAALMQKLFTEGIKGEKLKDSEIGKIPESWKVIKFATEDSGIEFIDGDRGSNYPKNNEFSAEGYCLFLSTKNVPGERFDFEECSFITEEKDRLLRKGKLQRGDIVLTTRGTVGNVAIYDQETRYENVRINSGMVILRNKNPELETEFLLTVLRSSIFCNQVLTNHSGSAQPQLPIGILRRLIFVLPKRDEQKVIIEIINAINEKIGLEQKKKDLYQELFEAMLDKLMSGEINVDKVNFS